MSGFGPFTVSDKGIETVEKAITPRGLTWLIRFSALAFVIFVASVIIERIHVISDVLHISTVTTKNIGVVTLALVYTLLVTFILFSAIGVGIGVLIGVAARVGLVWPNVKKRAETLEAMIETLESAKQDGDPTKLDAVILELKTLTPPMTKPPPWNIWRNETFKHGFMRGPKPKAKATSATTDEHLQQK